MSTTWEYLEIQVKNGNNPISILNARGAEGWECFYVFDQSFAKTFYMKRVTPEESSKNSSGGAASLAKHYRLNPLPPLPEKQ
jgi:hypothetical protein